VGVVHQDEREFAQAAVVRRHPGLLGAHIQRPVRRRRRELGAGLAHREVEAHDARGGRDRPRLGERQQFPQRHREAPGFAQDDLRGLARLGQVGAVEGTHHHARVPLDRGDRRLQLVGGVRHEALLLAGRRLGPREQAVERVGEQAQFVRGPLGQTPREGDP